MKKVTLVLASIFLGFASFAQNTTQLVSNYMNVKNALVKSDSKTATQAIHTFYTSIQSDGNFDQKRALYTAVYQLDKANTLEGQRKAFEEVSTIMWSIVKASDKMDNTVYYQFCPMKKAYWLSTEKKIENPYYGAAMLSCGKVADQK